MKTLLHFLLLNFLLISAFGQPVYFNNHYIAPETYWGGGNAILTLENNYLIIGIGSGYEGLDNKNIILGLANDNGDILQWINYGEPGYHYYPSYGSTILSTDNNILVGGVIEHEEYVDGLLYKLNMELDTIWSIIYHDTNSGYTFTTIKNIIENSNNNIIAVGQKRSQSGGMSDIMLLEISQNGIVSWEMIFPFGHYDRPASLVEGMDKGYLIGSFNYNPGQAYSGHAHVIKTDSLGNEEWTKWYGGAYRDGPAQVELAHDGNFIVGYSDALDEPTPGYPFSRITVLKIDNYGNTIWEKAYGGTYFYNSVNKVIKTPDGNYVAAGSTHTPSNWERAVGWLLKFNDNGDSLWYREYSLIPGDVTHYINDIDLTQDGGFILGGNINIHEEPIPPIFQYMWALKVDSMGCDTPGCATGTYVFELPASGVSEMRVWPNPVSDMFRVSCSGFCVKGEKVIRIYNSQGVKVEEIKVAENVGSLQIDASKYSKGLYYLQFVHSNQIIKVAKIIKN